MRSSGKCRIVRYLVLSFTMPFYALFPLTSWQALYIRIIVMNVHVQATFFLIIRIQVMAVQRLFQFISPEGITCIMKCSC